MASSKTTIAALAFLAVFSAEAHSREAYTPAASRDVRVELPASLIERVVPNMEARESSREKLDFAVSTWRPSDFEASARVAGATPFRVTGLPSLEASYLSAPLFTSAGTLAFRLGAGYREMSRSAAVTIQESARTDEQHLHVLRFFIGGEYSPAPLRSAGFSPYISGTLMPTMMVMTNSILADGLTSTGLGFEAGAGFALRLSRVMSWISGPELRLGVAQSFGKVDNANLSSLAVQAGLRVSI